MLDLEKMTFLTREQLEKQAPTVFALKPSDEVSKKYTHTKIHLLSIYN